MKKILSSLIALGFALHATAQMAVIQDKDGYTNVRQEPNGTSKIIHKINDGEVIYIGEQTNHWTEVQFHPTEIGKFSEDLIRRGTVRGYVHRSRLLLLADMPKYTGSDCSFQMVVAPFSKEGKTLHYEGDDETYLDQINHDPFWGTPGKVPSVEVQALHITAKGKKVEVPKQLLTDIYEVNPEHDCYKIGNTYVVHQQHGHGAALYEICWVFDEAGLKQRVLGTR